MVSGPRDAAASGDGHVLVVSHLGAQGDGVAQAADGAAVFVPFALPGERWRRRGGDVFERIDDAAERVAAPCSHFGACGGCVAQHMATSLYADWKSGIVRQALAHHGIAIDLDPLWRAPEGTRRRVVLSADIDNGRVRIGFRAARSHELVEIEACTIASPAIVAVLATLREIVAQLAPAGAALASDTRIHVLDADNGIDVLVEGRQSSLPADRRAALAGIAENGGLLRLAIGRDEIYQRAQPVLQVAGAALRVPAGGFVQAVGAAEAMMSDAVVRALGRAKNVADLFCGIGTFALPIAKRARVTAVDSQADAVAALADAVRHAQGLKPVTTLRRDLFREPFSRTELKGFDGVVFDPPRAGAAAQAEALARSKVPCIVAVSCNPATLARDLRTLIDGGYGLESVTPIDQFLYSAHVEAVAVLRR